MGWCEMKETLFFKAFLKNICLFIYLAVSNVGSSMWDLHGDMQDLPLWHTASPVLRHTGSVVVNGLDCPVTCGILVP